MRIDTHIFQIILIGLIFVPLFSFLNLSSNIIFLIFFGLFCGAIYPDTDCKESRIFKMKQDNQKIGWQKTYKEYRAKKNAQNIHNLFLFIYSSILIILGYFFRFILYYPSYIIIYLINKRYVKAYSVQDEHRGISHTLLGIFVASILFFILFFFANLYFKITLTQLLIIPFLSFFVAANIHLTQDSISKYGIKWFYPFRNTIISGNYSAFKDDFRITYLSLSLIFVVLLNYFLSNYIMVGLQSLSFILILLPFLFIFLIFYVLFKSCDVKISS